MSKIEDLEKENKELKAKIAFYEGLPTAKFYTALLGGLDHITEKIKEKQLDMDEDTFAKSIFTLAKDSDKIMSALGRGVESFKQIDDSDKDTKKAKKVETHQGIGI